MLTLLLGGARSGKSTLAEELARRSGAPVTFVATCPRIPDDDDLADRIDRHRATRPSHWTTVEEEVDLAVAIDRASEGFLVVDCLTLWVSNLVYRSWSPDEIEAGSQAAITAAARRRGDTVVVSNEVGLGIVPADAGTRAYRDLLGTVNRRWATAADRVLFLVAGRALPLLGPDDLVSGSP